MKNLKRVLAALLSVIICISVSSVFAVQAETTDAAELVSEMTLRQKIGQMMMISLRNYSNGEETTAITKLNDNIKEQLKEYGFGGVVLFGGTLGGTEQAARLTCELQNTMLAEDSVSKIPLLISADQEGGNIYRLQTGTVFGGNMSLAATGDTELTQNVAQKIGEEMDALGVNLDFAPVLDVNNNQSNPIIGVRSFSDDPQMVSRFGTAYINGLNSSGVAATVKHFPGHGDTDTDSHTGLPCVDKSYDELKETELVPFQAAINNGVDMIMTAHIQYPQIETTRLTSISSGEQVYIPATMSKKIITDILRGDMGYDGVVCTDSMAMAAITSNFGQKEAVKYAINAGVDMMLLQIDTLNADNVKDYGALVDAVEEMVNNGEISESRITESATRIIQLKINRGLINKTYNADEYAANALKIVGSKANHDFEWESVMKSITMVKNDDTLPIKAQSGQKIAFFTAYGNEVNNMQYAVDRLKAEGLIPDGVDIEIASYRNSTAEDVAETLKTSDYVFVISETYGDNYMNAEHTSGWQARFIDGAAKIVHENGNKLIVISCYLPYDAARYTEADAFLICYCASGMNVYPTEYNGETAAYGANLSAAVCVAFNEAAPTGKLPVNLRKLDENAKATDEVLYPIGYGLTYESEEPSTEAATAAEETTQSVTETETTQTVTVPAPDNASANSATKDSAVNPTNGGAVQTGESSITVLAILALMLLAIAAVYLGKKLTK